MSRTRSAGAPVALIRCGALLLAAYATAAFVPPARADEAGLALGLAGRDGVRGHLDPNRTSSPPEGFRLGADPAALDPVAPAGDAPVGRAGDGPDPAPALPPGAPTLAALPHRVWRDVGALVQRPLEFDSHDWTRLAIGAGLVGVVTAFDAHLRDTVQAHTSASARTFASRIRPLGTWGGVAAMGIVLGAGELGGDSDLARTGADGIEAALLAGVVVAPVLKELAGRQRPSTGNGSGGFEPVSKNQSFPSGEAAEAFALAAVVSDHARSPVVRGIAWGLAGLVGWERMALDAHWASDVVAGALIGSAVGGWVSRRNGAEGPGSLAVRPMVGPGVVGVTGSLSW